MNVLLVIGVVVVSLLMIGAAGLGFVLHTYDVLLSQWEAIQAGEEE